MFSTKTLLLAALSALSTPILASPGFCNRSGPNKISVTDINVVIERFRDHTYTPRWEEHRDMYARYHSATVHLGQDYDHSHHNHFRTEDIAISIEQWRDSCCSGSWCYAGNTNFSGDQGSTVAISIEINTEGGDSYTYA